MALRVRYSSFEKEEKQNKPGQHKLQKSIPKLFQSFEDKLNIIKLAPNETVLYRLQRPRSRRVLKIDTGSAIDKKESNTLPKISKPVKRSKLLNLSNEEKRCISVLRSRIVDVVNEIQKEKLVGLDTSRSNTLPAIQKRNKTAGNPVSKTRPNTHHVLLRCGRPQSATTRKDDLTQTESIMLKQVLTDILRRKLREESTRDDEISMDSNKKCMAERSGGSSRPQSGVRSRATNVTSERPVKDKGLSDVISEITNSGDNCMKQPRDRMKYGNSMSQQVQRPQVKLFSVAGSSRGSTADWVMKQKFEKYRS